MRPLPPLRDSIKNLIFSPRGSGQRTPENPYRDVPRDRCHSGQHFRRRRPRPDRSGNTTAFYAGRILAETSISATGYPWTGSCRRCSGCVSAGPMCVHASLAFNSSLTDSTRMRRCPPSVFQARKRPDSVHSWAVRRATPSASAACLVVHVSPDNSSLLTGYGLK